MKDEEKQGRRKKTKAGDRKTKDQKMGRENRCGKCASLVEVGDGVGGSEK
jgi:hypothetical protein